MASEVVQEIVRNHTLAILLSVWCGDIKYRGRDTRREAVVLELLFIGAGFVAKHNAIQALATMQYVELEACGEL
jgi:hypothetical protein